MNTEFAFPLNYSAFGQHIGIKRGNQLDFGVIHSEVPASAAAVFTKNRFCGNPIVVGRENIQTGRIQTIIVNSGNANVATGPAGLELVYEYCKIAAENLGISPLMIFPSSTGIIGRALPADIIKGACANIKEKLGKQDFESFSQAIMTTDAYPKMKTVELSNGIRIAGIAKGAGMIQPDMATMLSYILSDAVIESADLQRLLTCVANRTFNRLSVDGDTSTSDTVVFLSNGSSNIRVAFSEAAAAEYAELSDPFDENQINGMKYLDEVSKEFIKSAGYLCRDIVKLIARDGEGAEKCVELRVTEAKTREQAVKIGRSIINSPLFKTALHGADPNWGRIIMAVGKVYDEDIPFDGLKIFFGDSMLSSSKTPENLKEFSEYLKGEDIIIRVSLGTGDVNEIFWGCDLGEKYIKINSYYTT